MPEMINETEGSGGEHGKSNERKKVFVSGCFDLLHSGHIYFLQEAAKYGDLYVSIGNDANLKYLKNKIPIYSQDERLFTIKSLSCVKGAFVARGMGILDFLDELDEIKPDIFVVNEDGHSANKQKVIEDLQIEYVVLNLKRGLSEGISSRSTTSLRRIIQETQDDDQRSVGTIKIPYRIDICGGWLDQPFVSKLCSGSVVTFPVYGFPYEFKDKEFSFKDTINFSHRSGMASSTRRDAIDLWGNQIGFGDIQKLAKILFRYNNPPGTDHISGAQDSIGIVIPGITKSFYIGEFWPHSIDTITEDAVIEFIERHICLIPLQPRIYGYKPIDNNNITVEGAQALAKAARNTWQAIKNMDLVAFGRSVTDGFKAQVAMFPNMADEYVQDFINDVLNRNGDNILGYKLSGAGGGGHMICVVREPMPNSIVIKIPRGINSF